ncbi:MAG: hypothetical protein GWN99_00135 [Gemmatimonadetes bacterium]|uniref:Histidine kinase domain-containing protein n=1 Tax=Candidatus Kutchimonas denitrificans TaxID=3056748 RepID=A0AAE5CAN5_9BACT|nr:hypothetical protein [Gemmatimonadota bacterium]NIR73515.1 hypothetical protein [Candidatus Kutchimonas denitrificans]NIR99474.1 hypothetical protein [Gemmatimonadota bacterium]NIT65094.1 hypothetical protein [Gemmatimonadota bacterium]NIV23627.1 hypothetical protein [Gemmatimonadota bacterium]
MTAQRRLRLTLALAAFAALALILASQLYVWVNLWPLTVSWSEAFAWTLPQLLVWAAVIPGIYWFSRRLPVHGGHAAWRLPVHLFTSVGVSFLVLLTLQATDRYLGWSTLLGAPGKLVSDLERTVVHLHVGIGIYWVVFAVTHALRYYEEFRERELRASQLEAQLAQAQLQALRMQLNPHFLFNALNSIAVLMDHDPEGARAMLYRLSDLLNSTLRHGGSHEVPLSEELEHLESYLAIEEKRFRDRLNVSYDIDPETLDCAVPFLLLQPLVENALRHGIAPRTGPGHVAISARREDGRLSLSVRDDGPGLAPGSERPVEGGVGLSNTEARLQKLYGADHSLVFERPEAGGLEVRIEIPARVFQSAAAEGSNL